MVIGSPLHPVKLFGSSARAPGAYAQLLAINSIGLTSLSLQANVLDWVPCFATGGRSRRRDATNHSSPPPKKSLEVTAIYDVAGSRLCVRRGFCSTDGFRIAASKAKNIAQIAKRTIVSDNAYSVLILVLDFALGPFAYLGLFEAHGPLMQEWDKVRTDWLYHAG